MGLLIAFGIECQRLWATTDPRFRGWYAVLLFYAGAVLAAYILHLVFGIDF